MSSHEQEQTQILETCQRINQILQIPEDQFSLEALTHVDWYMTVLEILYPHLEAGFDQVRQMEDEAAAIDKMLLMLTQEHIIEEDFLEIKGQDIIEGDVESVYYVVQLLIALVEREQQGDDDEDEQQQENGQRQSESEHGHHNSHSERQYNQTSPGKGTQNEDQHEQYSNDFEEQQQHQNSLKQANQEPSPAQNLPKPGFNDPNMFKNAFNHYDSQDQPSHQEQRHSVLGIQNQFEDSDDDEEQDQQQQVKESSASKQYGNNATFGQQKSQSGTQIQQQPNNNNKKNPNQIPFYPAANQANNMLSQQKPQQQLKATGYKMTQNEVPKKQFSSSSEDEVNFEQQPSKNLKKKPSKDQKLKEDSQEEDQNEYFINPTIKKYKSDPKLIKTAGSGSKKSTTKKNLFKNISPANKQTKKLVSHPTIKKQYRKATNPQAKKLTQEVKAKASNLIKKSQKPIQVSSMINPSTTEMQRKKRQLKVKLADWKIQNHIRDQRKQKSNTIQFRSNLQLGKVLNWREGQLKREKKEFEKAMEMKLQVQKQAYVKKINNLLIKLQKQKELHERQQYKQHLIHENQEAAKRLTAIEQWYKDRIQMLKQNNITNKNERVLMHTGHKQILKQIEKELKRENQKQIMALTMKYRKQQAQVQNDLEELERQIIKVYKRN